MVQSIGGVESSRQIQATGSVGQFGENGFLQLLLAQLQNQDPLDPLKPQEFLGQLTQLQSLAELAGLRQDLVRLQNTQTLLGSLALLGRDIAWLDGSGLLQQGQVEEVRLGEAGAQLVAGGQILDYNQVQHVR